MLRITAHTKAEAATEKRKDTRYIEGSTDQPNSTKISNTILHKYTHASCEFTLLWKQSISVGAEQDHSLAMSDLSIKSGFFSSTWKIGQTVPFCVWMSS
jgi:hypothetical protein